MSTSPSSLSPEKRILLATSLCVVVSVFFSILMTPQKPPKVEKSHPAQVRPDAPPHSLVSSEPVVENSTAEIVQPATPESVVEPVSPMQMQQGEILSQGEPRPPVKNIVVDSPKARWTFSSQGGCLISCKIKAYRRIDPPVKLLESLMESSAVPELKTFWGERIKEVKARAEMTGAVTIIHGEPLPESMWVELIPQYADRKSFPLSIRLGDKASDEAIIYSTTGETIQLQESDQVTLSFQANSLSGISIRKNISLSGSTTAMDVAVGVTSTQGVDFLKKQFGSHWSLEWPDGLCEFPFHYSGSQEENLLRVLLNDSKESPTMRAYLLKQAAKAGQISEYRQGLDGRVGWINVETRYFIATFIPHGSPVQGVYTAERLNTRPTVDTRVGMGILCPFEESPRKLVVYAGPKITSVLAGLGSGLDRVVYDSWFDKICLIVEWFLKFFHSLIPSYGLAIILLCVASKLLLYPLTYKQAQMQKKMAELQPKIAELKIKYKDDVQKLNQEQMKLWKKHGVNPASGCLPMLAQLPIFIALYRTIQSDIDLRGASFLWIPDLSVPDMTFFLPMSLPFLGNALNVLPIIMTAVSLLQMKEQKKMMADPSQGNMMMFMTLFFFFLLYHFSAGLVLYWLTNSLTQWIQQKIMEYFGHAAIPAKVGLATTATVDVVSEDPDEESESPKEQPARKAKTDRKRPHGKK